MHRKRLLALVLASLASACGLVANLGDYESQAPTRTQHGNADAGADADVAVVDPEFPEGEGDGGIMNPPIDDGWADAATLPEAPSSCASEKLDPAGFFVSPGGKNKGACPENDPCGSVQDGINAAANSSGKKIVYVDKGSYEGTINLKAGVTVQGGWDFAAKARICTIQRAGVVNIKASTIETTTVRTSGAGATLDTLTVSLRPFFLNFGASVYGIFATHSLTLRDVLIDVNSSGALGGNGDTGGRLANNCATTGSDAGAGTPGSAAAPAANGTFGVTGYDRGNGNNGANGTSGNTSPIQSGESVDCVTSCGADDAGVCGPTMKEPKTANPSVPGCGGGAGKGGEKGYGGGSSIGLYAFGASITVTVDGGQIRAGSGGVGGAGGAGTSGASGVLGTAGQDVMCGGTACSTMEPCATTLPRTLKGGAASTGGAGGAGSPGTGGAGGAAYATYAAGGAKVVASSTVKFLHGAGGPGGRDGAPLTTSGPTGPEGNQGP